MMSRRSLVLAGWAMASWPLAAFAQQRASLANPLRLGVDLALAESGLARSLQRAFGRDTGIAVQWVASPAVPLLDALERGELDAALTNAPDAELKLDKQGLVHDRRPVARSAMVLVGPAPKGRAGDPAGIAGGHDVAQALQRIAAAAVPGGAAGVGTASATARATATAAVPAGAAGPAGASPSGAVVFMSSGDGSGTHVAEQALWRAARIAPAAPWYVAARAGQSLAAQARARNAYALVERGSWAAIGGAPLAVLVEGDPLMDMPVHVMRSFRVNHPAAKIFVGWISGPKGARVVAAQRGYRPLKA